MDSRNLRAILGLISFFSERYGRGVASHSVSIYSIYPGVGRSKRKPPYLCIQNGNCILCLYSIHFLPFFSWAMIISSRTGRGFQLGFTVILALAFNCVHSIPFQRRLSPRYVANRRNRHKSTLLPLHPPGRRDSCAGNRQPRPAPDFGLIFQWQPWARTCLNPPRLKHTNHEKQARRLE